MTTTHSKTHIVVVECPIAPTHWLYKELCILEGDDCTLQDFVIDLADADKADYKAKLAKGHVFIVCNCQSDDHSKDILHIQDAKSSGTPYRILRAFHGCGAPSDPKEIQTADILYDATSGKPLLHEVWELVTSAASQVVAKMVVETDGDAHETKPTSPLSPPTPPSSSPSPRPDEKLSSHHMSVLRLALQMQLASQLREQHVAQQKALEQVHFRLRMLQNAMETQLTSTILASDAVVNALSKNTDKWIAFGKDCVASLGVVTIVGGALVYLSKLK